jgi:hypothetical protein
MSQIPHFTSVGPLASGLRSVLTPLHEQQGLPGVPHFSQSYLRCLWQGFGQGHLPPTHDVLHNSCVLVLLSCFLASSNVWDAHYPSHSLIHASSMNCCCSGLLIPQHSPPEPDHCTHSDALTVPKDDAAVIWHPLADLIDFPCCQQSSCHPAPCDSSNARTLASVH